MRWTNGLSDNRYGMRGTKGLNNKRYSMRVQGN